MADTLEADWNHALRALADAQDEYEQLASSDRQRLDEETRQEVLALASDFPRIWRDEKTPDLQRKRMVRLLIEDVTLVKGPQTIQTQVRLRGGATRSLDIFKPLTAGEARKTDTDIVHEIDRLLDQHTTGEIALLLNQQGRTSGEHKPFTNRIVQRICRAYNLKSRYQRLRDRGLLTVVELAEHLQVTRQTINIWRRNGLLEGHSYNDKHECLYDIPNEHSPCKSQGQKLSERSRFPQVPPQSTNEVQDAT